MLAQLLAAQAELEPQFRVLKGVMGALNTPVKLAGENKADALSLTGILKVYDQQVKRIVNPQLENNFLPDLQKAWQDCLDKRKQRPTDESIHKIVGQLTFARYLQTGWLGEWKPDEKLQELLDKHEIYSNMGADVGAITAVDAHTDRSYPPGTVVLFGGLLSAPGAVVDDILCFATSYAVIPYQITQAVARSLAVLPGQMVWLPEEPGGFLFHFWGTVWGELFTAVLVGQGISAETINEYCAFTRQPWPQLPPLDEKHLQKAARELSTTFANRLEMGRFHRLLPADVATAATIQQLNLPQFREQYHAAKISIMPPINGQLELLAQ